MTQFQKGHPGGPGRVKGSRNRIAYKLIEALEKDFQEHGGEAIKNARIERPVEYLRIIASVIPKEFEIVDSRLGELSDEELDVFIAKLRAQLRSPAITDAGERFLQECSDDRHVVSMTIDDVQLAVVRAA